MEKSRLAMKKIGFFASVILVVFLMACGGATVTHRYTSPVQEFRLEGPLFAGANTAQATLAPEMVQAFLAEQGSGLAQLKRATLSGFTLEGGAGSPNFNWAEEMTLQVAADAVDMQQFAVLNPVPEGASSLELQVTQEVELTPYLQQPAMFLVLDANLSEDMMDTTLVFTGTLSFDLEVAE